mmetsp:Transcript_23706/g.44050  ORF Transcript_23706/g.44050 Transcript_23706/m.44050 type:complete len:212 (-) Transcript_23706:485-1120(-)
MILLECFWTNVIAALWTRNTAHVFLVISHSQVHSIGVVCRRHCLQHGCRLWERSAAGKHFSVRFDEGTKFSCHNLSSVNNFRFEVLFMKYSTAIAIQQIQECFVHLGDFTLEILLNHSHTGVRQSKTGDLIKAGTDLFPCILHLFSLSLRNDLFKILIHFLLHLIVVFLVFKVLPITNEEFDSLERFFIDSLLWSSSISLYSHSSKLGKQS